MSQCHPCAASSVLMGDRLPRRVPLSLEDLKKKRDEAEAAETKLVYVPRGLRTRSTNTSLVSAESAANVAGSVEPAHVRREDPLSLGRVLMNPRVEGTAILTRIEDASSRGGRPASRQQHEKTRFRFEWDADDDTNVDADDSLYGVLRKRSFSGTSATHRHRWVAEVPENELLRGTPYKESSDLHQRRKARRVNSGEAGSAKPGSNELSSKDYGRDRGTREPRVGEAGASSGGRHWSEKKRANMSERDWAIFREDNNIAVRGGTSEAARPARDWGETGLPSDILHLVCTVAGYEKPSPIQMAAIPVGLRRCDLIGLAETGSGKTAAFVLPMLVHVRNMPRLTAEVAALGPYVLIIAPTRELVLQIESETKKFAVSLGFRVMSVIGGQGLEEQGLTLQSGCEIVVCTPGRMVDLLSRRLAALGNCNYLILDEADRMIDMGFEPQVQQILDAMPVEVAAPERGGVDGDVHGTRRQTFMFSATMSPVIERLAREYLSKPTVITVGETGKAADAVDQRVEFITSEGKKRERLVKLLNSLEPPVIVFANTKKGCEDVARLIESGCGIRPLVLHSGKSQEQREESLGGFKAGRFGVLVATDVLGRGIDIKGVNHVVNFELPKTIASYTHRIGRTGRAGHKGIAWSLATAADAGMFPDLKAYLEQSDARVCPAIARFSGGRDLKPIVD